jgi:hypothetical protein
MKVVLNPNLVEVPALQRNPRYKSYRDDMNAFMPYMTERLLGWKGFKTTLKDYVSMTPREGRDRLTMGFMGTLADCYSRHRKFRLSPTDMWFVAMSETAKLVNAQPEVYRHLFTDSDQKKEITVMTGDPAQIGISALIQQLVGLLPKQDGYDTLELMVPELSTSNSRSSIAVAACFCDMVQSYYSYSTMMCGLPELDVAGVVEDWTMLTRNTEALGEMFGSTPAGVYMVQLNWLFSAIAAQFMLPEPNVDFWKDIFRTKNVGSGGELEINGWIAQLYPLDKRGKKLENFEIAVGGVPYKNLETQREFTAYYGAFSELIDADGFVYLDYDYFVIERNPKE